MKTSQWTQTLRVRLLSLLLGVAWGGAPATGAETYPGGCRWFSLPLEVAGVPTNAVFIPVTATLPFNEILSKLNETGLVDTRSLRLFRVLENGEQAEEPHQFTPLPLPRLRERFLLPGTPPQVSYLGEYVPGKNQPDLPISGRLTWIVRHPVGSSCRYVLKFGIPRQGVMVQVPYGPHDLHWFDETHQAVSPAWFARLQIRPQQLLDGRIEIFEDQQPWTTYFAGPRLSELPTAHYRRPFFYPVLGPDGIGLTGFGKPHDPTESHAHHYSLWIAHANVNGADFWSERGGLIVHEQMAELEDGPLYCRFIQKTRWQFKETTLLQERRQCTFYPSEGAGRLMDIELELTPAGPPVVFGKTTFGFLAVRVAQSMSPFDGGGEIRNARGDLNEQGAHLKNAPWLDQSGPIAPGKWGGIALFDHPDNPRYPTAWHCRNDGWAGASFNKDEPFTLSPGEYLRLRYRLFLHRHNAAQGEVARRFLEWTARPKVQWGEPGRLP